MTPRERHWYLAALVVTALCVLLDIHSLWVCRRRERAINAEIAAAREAGRVTLTGDGTDRARHYHPGSAEGPTGDSAADLEALRAYLGGEDQA